jgi:hypothetical protein
MDAMVEGPLYMGMGLLVALKDPTALAYLRPPHSSEKRP